MLIVSIRFTREKICGHDDMINSGETLKITTELPNLLLNFSLKEYIYVYIYFQKKKKERKEGYW